MYISVFEKNCFVLVFMFVLSFEKKKSSAVGSLVLILSWDLNCKYNF